MPQLFKLRVVNAVRSASRPGSRVVRGFCAKFNVRKESKVLKVVGCRLEMPFEAKERVVSWTLFVNMFWSTVLKPISFKCKVSSLTIRWNAVLGSDVNFKPLRFKVVKLVKFDKTSKSIDVNWFDSRFSDVKLIVF